MNFTKLDKDLSHVSALPDIPTLENGYTPEGLKKIFDRAGEDIKEYINTVLISELENSGAERIGTAEIETVQGASVQEKLENLALQIKDISNASIPEGTLVPEKFVPSVASFLTEGSLRCAYYSEAGEYTFIPTRTGNYKVTVQGAGAGGGVTGNYRASCGGGSGAVAIGWLRLETGKEYTVKIGRGGKSITLSDEGQFIASCENGEASGFYSDGTELLYADGGAASKSTSTPVTARGGTLNINGRFPGVTDIESGYAIFSDGAESYFASSTVSFTATPGAGAGGYGARALEGSYYSRAGSAGGDGAVLIEWME